ncbi:MAG: hypothetical protein HY303_00410 [Candidatus Wallbacteria bacterium]|nr:hypothetical protein [Candidatus Wallbacteria bacterium]
MQVLLKGAGVHGDATADTARDLSGELQPAQAHPGNDVGHPRKRHPSAGCEQAVFADRKLVETIAQDQQDARKTVVGEEKVAALADHPEGTVAFCQEAQRATQLLGRVDVSDRPGRSADAKRRDVRGRVVEMGVRRDGVETSEFWSHQFFSRKSSSIWPIL